MDVYNILKMYGNIFSAHMLSGKEGGFGYLLDLTKCLQLFSALFWQDQSSVLCLFNCILEYNILFTILLIIYIKLYSL